MLEVSTLLWVLALGNGLSFILSTSGDRRTFSWQMFLLARVFQCLGWGIQASVNPADSLLTLVSRLLILAGYSCEMVTFADLKRLRIPFLRYHSLLMAVSTMVLLGGWYVRAGNNTTYAGTSALLLLTFLPLGVAYLRRSLTRLETYVGWLCLGYAGTMVLRLAWAVTEGRDIPWMAPHHFHTYSLALAFIELTASNQGYMLLKQQKRSQEVMSLALTDALTGIPNRRAFFDSGRALVDWAVRQRLTVAMLIIDVDFFKLVNDRFGHAAGDQALCAFANELKGLVRAHDVLGRIGGEEFAVVMQASEGDAFAIAERIRLQTLGLRFGQYPELSLSVSVGLSCAVPQSIGDFEQLMLSADRGLYQSKHQGRNRVEVVRDVLFQTASVS